jgi:hypothetical protein
MTLRLESCSAVLAEINVVCAHRGRPTLRKSFNTEDTEGTKDTEDIQDHAGNFGVNSTPP